MSDDTVKITKSSGNIFADLGLPDADELLMKTKAVVFIKERLAASGMSQVELARRAGLPESNVSELLSGRVNRYGIERINRLMAVFGACIKTHYTLHVPEAAE